MAAVASALFASDGRRNACGPGRADFLLRLVSFEARMRVGGGSNGAFVKAHYGGVTKVTQPVLWSFSVGVVWQWSRGAARVPEALISLLRASFRR